MQKGLFYTLVLCAFQLCAMGFNSASVKCMLTCSKSDCTLNAQHFVWCMTYCSREMSYKDLKTCFEAFDVDTKKRLKTCVQRLAPLTPDHLERARLFCEVNEEIFLKKRLDHQEVRRELFIRALQELAPLRELVKIVA